jgi:Nucleotidyl transferase AbiEii toxin, Type IV TA system
MWVADLRQQYAEKLHALTRIYETGESTRVRDLVDLVLLVEDALEPDAELVARVRLVFTVRRAHAVPGDLPDPPAAWRESYAALADEIGLTVSSYTDAHAIVAMHWARARAAKEV